MNAKLLFIQSTLLSSAAIPFLTSLRPLQLFSLGGAISFLIFLLSILLFLFMRHKYLPNPASTVPLFLLCALNTIHFFTTTNSSPESNVSIFIWPALLIILLIASTLNTRKYNLAKIKNVIKLGLWLYIPLALYFGIRDGHAPALALSGMPFFFFCLAQTEDKRIYFLPLTIIILAHIILSARIVVLTETALLAYAIIFSNSKINTRGRIAQKAIAASLLISALFLILNSGVLDKTVTGGDKGVEIGSISINTSGRINMWEAIFVAALDKPIIGSGLAVPNEISKIPGWAHPHNDYLRLFHQTGIIGLGLWLAFIAFNLIDLKRKISNNGSVEDAIWHKLSIYMLTALSITMLTDNSIVYSYVIYPTAIFLGISSAIEKNNNKTMCHPR